MNERSARRDASHLKNWAGAVIFERKDCLRQEIEQIKTKSNKDVLTLKVNAQKCGVNWNKKLESICARMQSKNYKNIEEVGTVCLDAH